jgi:hypothetical protein
MRAMLTRPKKLRADATTERNSWPDKRSIVGRLDIDSLSGWPHFRKRDGDVPIIIRLYFEMRAQKRWRYEKILVLLCLI